MVHSRCAAVDVQFALEIVLQGVEDAKERCATMMRQEVRKFFRTFPLHLVGSATLN